MVCRGSGEAVDAGGAGSDRDPAGEVAEGIRPGRVRPGDGPEEDDEGGEQEDDEGRPVLRCAPSLDEPGQRDDRCRYRHDRFPAHRSTLSVWFSATCAGTADVTNAHPFSSDHGFIRLGKLWKSVQAFQQPLSPDC